MAIPMTSFTGALADLEHNRAGIVFDRAIPDERRSKIRYPLDLIIRFRLLSASSGFSGVGRTVNLSSGGILVSQQGFSQREIREGTLLEMSIEWPSLLDGRIPLQLLAVDRVVRRGASVFAARFERHQFHTRSSSQVPAQS